MNIDGPDLEDRYRRVLRLLPGYYRDQWEDDMAAAYLDSRKTGDEDEDDYICEFGRPAWPEVASVAAMLQAQFAGYMLRPLGWWSSRILLGILPVLAMAAFHRDAPPAPSRRRPGRGPGGRACAAAFRFVTAERCGTSPQWEGVRALPPRQIGSTA